MRSSSSPRLWAGSTPTSYSSLAAAARSAKRSNSRGFATEAPAQSPEPAASPTPNPQRFLQFSPVSAPRLSPFGVGGGPREEEEQQQQQQLLVEEFPHPSQSSRYIPLAATPRTPTRLRRDCSYGSIFAPFFDHQTVHVHDATARSTLLSVARHVALSNQIQQEAKRLRHEVSIEDVFAQWDRHRKGFVTYTDLVIFSQEHDPLQECSNLSGIRCLVAEAHKIAQNSSGPAPKQGQLTFRELALLLVPFGGREFEALLDTSSDQEARSALYILRSSEPCPKCRYRIQRSGDCSGCPIVTCPICDHAFRCVTVVSDENPRRAVRTEAEVGRKLRFGINAAARAPPTDATVRAARAMAPPMIAAGPTESLAGTVMTATSNVTRSRSCGALGTFRSKAQSSPDLFDFLAASSKYVEAVESLRRGLWGKDLWTCFSLLSQGKPSISSQEDLANGLAKANLRLNDQEVGLLWQGVTRHAGSSKLYQSRTMEFEAFVRYLQPSSQA